MRFAKSMATLGALMLVALAAGSSQPQAGSDASAKLQNDPILTAVRAELARAQALTLDGQPSPYYVSLGLVDMINTTISARWGEVTSAGSSRDRSGSIALRVGSEVRDNSRLLQFQRPDLNELPIDDEPHALRRGLWLNLDQIYKQELENLARKSAALARLQQTTVAVAPDFTRPRGTAIYQDGSEIELPLAAWKAKLKVLSALLRRDDLSSSEVDLMWQSALNRFADTDGNLAHYPSIYFSLTVRAQAQATDGMMVRSHLARVAAEIDELPDLESLRAEVLTLGDQVAATAAAPAITEPYVGPVLFEDDAAAEVLATLIAHGAAAAADPVFEDPRMAEMFNARVPPSPWIGRLGKRVASRGLTIVDDSTRSHFGELALIGHYQVDEEGVVPRPVTLVERGILRGLLSSRTPRSVGDVSTGHGRGIGPTSDFFGNVRPAPGVIVVSEADGEEITTAAVRERFLEMIDEEGLDYGIVIRRVRNLALDPLETDESSGMVVDNRPSAVGAPVACFRVTAKGDESPARGLRFGRLDTRSLRDVTMISSGSEGTRAYNLVIPPPGLPRGYLAVSVIGPRAILFEELELTPQTGPFPRPPLVPRPLVPKVASRTKARRE